ncbi:MAG: pectinesterase family protein [Emticicia sp.]|nr:pectinesterase family protein [Emticicia sp.]
MNKLPLILFFLVTNTLFAQNIAVAQDGSEKYKTIQEALNSLDTVSTNQRTIFIKNGIYREKTDDYKVFFETSRRVRRWCNYSCYAPT